MTRRNDQEKGLVELKFTQAAANLAAIFALPQGVGDQVVWSNGVTWTREDDNKWFSDIPGLESYYHPSAHICGAAIVMVRTAAEAKAAKEQALQEAIDRARLNNN